MEHELVRYLRQKSTNKIVAKCSCGGIHSVAFDELDHKVTILKDDVEEINDRQRNVAPAPEEKVVT